MIIDFVFENEILIIRAEQLGRLARVEFSPGDRDLGEVLISESDYRDLISESWIGG